jgi:hypothetical protein
MHFFTVDTLYSVHYAHVIIHVVKQHLVMPISQLEVQNLSGRWLFINVAFVTIKILN